MKKINFENLKPIEGFKVMEWLRAVREKYHELYMRDPEEYDRKIKMIDKKTQAYRKKNSKG